MIKIWIIFVMNAKNKRIVKMKLHEIVNDFTLGTLLKELGVTRKALFYYNPISSALLPSEDFESLDFAIPAYTVAELGEMLPSSIKVSGKGSFIIHGLNLPVSREYSLYMQHVCDPNDIYDELFFTDKKESNARAKLLIWLIENKNVNVEELNNA
jgi:hypothetical protein